MFVWLPVAVMLLVIARESTESFGSMHTSAMLRPVYESVFGAVENERWEHIHHAIRKSGHFIGYGTLGITWLRAFLYRWLVPLRFEGTKWWRWLAWRMALSCTAVVAGLDELHQTWIPGRTGVAEDVLLDTFGAVTLCGVVALVWLLRSRGSNQQFVWGGDD